MGYTTTAHSAYLPILIFDANAAAAYALAGQIRHYGLSTDVATSCSAAHAAIRLRHYGSIVVVADLGQPSDVSCIEALRNRSLSTWIVVISQCAPPPEAQRLIWRRGADSLLIAPFSVQELISRLFAFSLRSRTP